jgi:predicted porin
LVNIPTVASAGAIIPNSTSVSRSGGTVKDAFRVTDGNASGVGTSRIGFRGTEDLGGGMKANFQMEMGLRLDDGSTGGGGAGGSGGSGGGNLFGRNAWVGASGAFGEVRLGRQVAGSFGVHANGLADAAAGGLYSAGATAAGAFASGGGALAGNLQSLRVPTAVMAGVRYDNAIKYISPNLGGFTGTLTIKAPEGNGDTTSVVTPAGVNPTITSGTTSAKNKTGFDLAAEYANGPIYAGFGYFKLAGSSAGTGSVAIPTVGTSSTTSGGDFTTKGYAFSGSYNLGVVQPFLSYVNVKGTDTGVTGTFPIAPAPASVFSGSSSSVQKVFTAGLKAPFGPVTVIGSFSRNKLSESGSGVTISGNPATAAGLTESGSGKATAFNIGAQYALSKRTMLEANYGQVKATKSVDTATVLTNATATGLVNINSTVKTSAIAVGVRHTF